MRVVYAGIACVAIFMVVMFMLDMQCHLTPNKVLSTRFGVVDCGPLPGNSQLCVVKDDSTKQRYLVCIHCEVQEYRRKK